MFLKKRRLKYQDFINNVEVEAMRKPKTKPKIQTLLDKINPPVEKMIKQKMRLLNLKPKTNGKSFIK